MVLWKSSVCLLLPLLVLSTSPMFGLGTVVSQHFPQLTFHQTHQEAQSYCQSNHFSLAIFQSDEDMNSLSPHMFSAWIGLKRTTDVWVWTSGPGLEYSQWEGGEPTNKSLTCAYYTHSTKQFTASLCERSMFYLCSVNTRYEFFSELRTWTEAQDSCKTLEMDLANFIKNSEMSRIMDQDFPVWIQQSPDLNASDGQCVTVTTKSKQVSSQDCEASFPFVCSHDNVLLVTDLKSWEEAVGGCTARDQQQLLRVHTQDQDLLGHKTSRATSQEVWVGLRFLGGTWFWIDGVPMDYPGLPQCPPPGQHCGVLSKTAEGVSTADCAEKKNFLCYM